MKTITNFVFKTHIKIFGYPCRYHIRLAIQNNLVYNLAWRVGMLYVCQESISSIADWHSISSKEVKKLLNGLAEEFEYE
jgi:hypothetical protein